MKPSTHGDSAPVLVVALNPSIDAEWRVDDVVWEEKNLVRSERRWAGGKGVNVARWLTALGTHPRLLLPLGAATGNELLGYLKAEKLPASVVSISARTRVNVIVTTASGRQLRFNPLGPKLTRSEWNRVMAKANREFSSVGCVVLSGSLPREAPQTVYSRFIRSARSARCNTLLDCDGAAFAHAIKAKPFLVKPNDHELSQWCGRTLQEEPEIIREAQRLSSITNGWVLVSRGKRGALLANVQSGSMFKAAVPAVSRVNTVGAGDAMLAAVAQQIAIGAPAEDWLRWGVAAGTCATLNPPGVLAKPGQMNEFARQIKVRPLRS